MWLIDIVKKIFVDNGLVWAFLVVGIVYFVATFVNKIVFRGKFHNFTIAMLLALIIAYIVGGITKGSKGLADLPLFAGVGLLGGAMLRDYAIVATAYGAKIDEIKKGGIMAVISLLVGVIGSFLIGVIIARIFGFTDVKDITTIGGGACTFIVGPVTGEALGASSGAVTLSIAAGVVKSVLAMLLIPLLGRLLRIRSPQEAMVLGGLIGTTSGTVAGLTALDENLVPYGAMTATFYTGLGCLLVPSIGFILVRLILG